MLGAMAAGTAIVLFVATRRTPEATPVLAQPKAQPQRPAEDPWLSKDAAAQIVQQGGELGSLFGGLELGGPAPSQEMRDSIEKFARANRVNIELEISEGRLDAIHFNVTYSGCCGYEAADVLATRLDRPSVGGGCMGGTPMWINDWAMTKENGTYMRARVRTNRVDVRWEKTLTTAALLERANGLLGQDAVKLKAAERSRWVEFGNQNMLTVPFPFQPYGFGYAVDMRDADYGLQLVVAHARIAEVSFMLPDLGDDGVRFLTAKQALLATWGRPRLKTKEMWTWRSSDRLVTAEIGIWRAHVSIRELR